MQFTLHAWVKFNQPLHYKLCNSRGLACLCPVCASQLESFKSTHSASGLEVLYVQANYNLRSKHVSKCRRQQLHKQGMNMTYVSMQSCMYLSVAMLPTNLPQICSKSSSWHIPKIAQAVHFDHVKYYKHHMLNPMFVPALECWLSNTVYIVGISERFRVSRGRTYTLSCGTRSPHIHTQTSSYIRTICTSTSMYGFHSIR